ncbi:hypothetical protein B0T18DRAFT_386100 [Schizothecium vesticola]|uniref:Uncharacterized protein n=1 Tax=Schizothecium vesticola TaxID=314040 RepID=A0AA40FAD4_9PEZI|nr:hypothetical protein B0T18DRAFT_386100 [Schizothecium vesticola]
MGTNMFSVDNMRQAFDRASQILGLLKSELEGMKLAGLGCIKVDISVGAVRGVYVATFTDVLGETESFVGLAETFPPNAQHLVEGRIASIIPPLLELERLLMQMYDLEHFMVEAATTIAPMPLLVAKETEARLDALANETLVKLKAFETRIVAGKDDLNRCKAQLGSGV